jgi:hypothetical protein
MDAPNQIKLYSEAIIVFPSHKMSIYQRDKDQFHKQHNYVLEPDDSFFNDLHKICEKHGAYIGPQKPHESRLAIKFNGLEIKRRKS